MALDFQQIRQQVTALGENAPLRQEELRNLGELARKLLNQHAINHEYLIDKVTRAARLVPNLRCATPTREGLTETLPLPAKPHPMTIIATDGSQINPDRHLPVQYALVNIGAIQMVYGRPEAPQPMIRTELLYDEAVYSLNGMLTEREVAGMRDLRERAVLAELTEGVEGPVMALIDGPIEIWESAEISTNRFERYLEALARLQRRGVALAGYVDKPAADMVVRLLELAVLEDDKLAEAGKQRWLRRISDTSLFINLLRPGERTALFGVQSQNTARYNQELALHFFYLNVSQDENQPYLARVEVPGWVVQQPGLLNSLHTVLVEQCQIVAGSPFPYLLHRAHETAVVQREEKEQVENMIAVELRRRGVHIGSKSAKQSQKDFTTSKR